MESLAPSGWSKITVSSLLPILISVIIPSHGHCTLPQPATARSCGTARGDLVRRRQAGADEPTTKSWPRPSPNHKRRKDASPASVGMLARGTDVDLTRALGRSVRRCRWCSRALLGELCRRCSRYLPAGGSVAVSCVLCGYGWRCLSCTPQLSSSGHACLGGAACGSSGLSRST